MELTIIFTKEELKELEHLLMSIPPGCPYNYEILNNILRKIEKR